MTGKRPPLASPFRPASFLLLLAACAGPAAAAAPEPRLKAPAATVESREAGRLRTALFAGGCFWGIEAVFSHLKGVKGAVSGYHGGTRAEAEYERVSAGRTGHAETVQVTYDPAAIRYDQLLRVFFSVGADPTLLNRQGPDEGPHYRSALIPLDAEQRRVAEAYLRQMAASGLWRAPIVTRIEPHRAFYRAEVHHQDFAANNPDHGYIRFWDAPKVSALRRLFPDLFKATFTRG